MYSFGCDYKHSPGFPGSVYFPFVLEGFNLKMERSADLVDIPFSCSTKEVVTNSIYVASEWNLLPSNYIFCLATCIQNPISCSVGIISHGKLTSASYNWFSSVVFTSNLTSHSPCSKANPSFVGKDLHLHKNALLPHSLLNCIISFPLHLIKIAFHRPFSSESTYSENLTKV